MPLLSKSSSYKPRADVELNWNTFRKGWNNLFRETELSADQLAQADNIMLIGSGTPTGRWGTQTYFTANLTGTITGLGAFATGASLVQVLAVTDQGYLVKKNGTSYTQVNGQSWPSGTMVRMEQLGGYEYLVSKDVALTRYDGTGLAVFATIAPPTGLTATNISGVSGTYTWSWKIVAKGSNGGTTEPSTAVTLGNLPQDLSLTSVNVRWTGTSAASLSGYEVYRGLQGDETFLAGVGASITNYIDTGEPSSESILAPISNTTGGVKAEVIGKVGDRLIFVPYDDPTKLIIGARYPDQSKIGIFDGGGYIYLGPRDGGRIVGVNTQLGSEKFLAFTTKGVYAITLGTITVGNYVLLDPQYQVISTLTDCTSQDVIQTVENDTFYLGTKGVYVAGFEPNYLNLIRTNEVSAPIRPYLAGLSASDLNTACAFYVNNKYIISFPNRKEMIVYDRERGCWIGPWILPFGVSVMKKIDDGTGEKWIVGSKNSNKIYTFEPSVNSDDGVTITKTLRSKKEYFTSWSDLKLLKYFYFLFRNVTGSVNVNIIAEDRNGTTSNVKTFTLTGSETAGNSGWGIDTYGTSGYGLSNGTITTATGELTRWGTTFKSVRIIQIEISCTSANSNFELLGVKLTAKNQGSGLLPSSQKV